jgi:D-amino peptidase
MKIYVMVDMEGISGICRRAQIGADIAEYQRGRRFMTWDVNACIEGCFNGGAKELIVRDAHCSGFNLIWEELDPRARYIQGSTGAERMPELKGSDGLILLGYHSMAGTPCGTLEHTMSSNAWQNFYINGKKSGEIAIDAGIAGDLSVPLIMVSGDDKACAEAKKIVTGVCAAEVKKGLSAEGAVLLPKEKAHELIRTTSKKAVENCRKIKPFKIKAPVAMRLELISRGIIPAGRAGVKVIDGRTFEITGNCVEETLNKIL